MAIPLNSNEICIKGNKYRIVDTNAEVPISLAPEQYYPEQEQTGVGGLEGGDQIGGDQTYGEQPVVGETIDMVALESKVDKIIDILGSGSINGGYRSVNLTLPPREQKYQVMFGLYANQLHIRADQGLTVNMNSPSGEDVFIEVSEFPFSLSELPRNVAIHTLYFTTGANETHIKILAMGTVG
jgi:hypothetical protein